MMFYVNKSIFVLDFVWIYFVYDVGKVLYKYCTSTFPISTLIIMYNMWWYRFLYVAFCDIFLNTYTCCVHLLICVPFLNLLLLKEGFFVFEVVSGQKSVLSGNSPMSVPPPKRGKFIFDHT